MSTKVVNNSLIHTTGILSEEGIRSDISMNNYQTLFDFTGRDEKPIEEIHYIQVALNRGIQFILRRSEMKKEEEINQKETEIGDLTWFDTEIKISDNNT